MWYNYPISAERASYRSQNCERKVKILKGHRIIAAALAAVIAVGLGTAQVKVSAEEDVAQVTRSGTSESISAYDLQRTDERNVKNYLSLSSVPNKSVWSYTRKTVKLLGTALSVKSLEIGGVSYIPFRAAANALGASYSYNSATGTSTMKVSGLTLTASSGCYVAYGNGRALFTMSPTVIMSDGRMYIPAEVFTKATGLVIAESQSLITIGGSFKPLVSAEKFYREDEVYWLSRIINAESCGEPLLGQIAVGDVVLNRVRSPEYPNTIYGVIFDRKYGVQFSPILNGSIYDTPCYNSVLAAKICLEGVDVTSGVKFFLHPATSSSHWIPKTREYAFTIGRHDFYY